MSKDVIKPKRPRKIETKDHSSCCPLISDISDNLDENIAYFKAHFHDCTDVIFRSLAIDEHDICIIFTDGMIDNTLLSEGILKAIFSNIDKFANHNKIFEVIKKSITTGQISEEQNAENIITKILSGNIVILINGSKKCLIISIPGWKQRSIGTSEIEPSLRGAKDSFTETLNVNISLVRRRLLHPDCKFHNITIGKYSQTRIAVAYISSIVNQKLLKELLNRLNSIDTDIILESNYLEEFIEDAPFSIFPTILVTERPDKAAAALIEGKMIVMQENSPFALMLPSLMIDFLQSPDDYYGRYWIGSFLRILRFISLLIAVLAPALFVALTTFNQELIPTQLLLSFARQRAGIPFPAAAEAILMGIIFEILKEAGTRLPTPIGQTVSIVGALIIGEAAVSAGLISATMVIVTALTAIATFTIPTVEFSDPVLFVRLVLTLLSTFLGFWGIFIGLILFLGHLVSLRSLGIPYTIPMSPVQIEDLDDVLLRMPLWQNKKRPRILTKINQVRMGRNQKPAPPGKKGGN